MSWHTLFLFYTVAYTLLTFTKRVYFPICSQKYKNSFPGSFWGFLNHFFLYGNYLNHFNCLDKLYLNTMVQT